MASSDAVVEIIPKYKPSHLSEGNMQSVSFPCRQ